VEGVAILSAVLAVATVTATNDYSKDQQFRALNKVKDDINITVSGWLGHAHMRSHKHSCPLITGADPFCEYTRILHAPLLLPLNPTALLLPPLPSV
jgi:hypothetical protein